MMKTFQLYLQSLETEGKCVKDLFYSNDAQVTERSLWAMFYQYTLWLATQNSKHIKATDLLVQLKIMNGFFIQAFSQNVDMDARIRVTPARKSNDTDDEISIKAVFTPSFELYDVMVHDALRSRLYVYYKKQSIMTSILGISAGIALMTCSLMMHASEMYTGLAAVVTFGLGAIALGILLDSFKNIDKPSQEHPKEIADKTQKTFDYKKKLLTKTLDTIQKPVLKQGGSPERIENLNRILSEHILIENQISPEVDTLVATITENALLTRYKAKYSDFDQYKKLDPSQILNKEDAASDAIIDIHELNNSLLTRKSVLI